MDKLLQARNFVASYKRGASTSPTVERVGEVLWEAVTQAGLSKEDFVQLVGKLVEASYNRGMKHILLPRSELLEAVPIDFDDEDPLFR